MLLIVSLLLLFQQAFANPSDIICNTVGQTTFFITKPSSYKIIDVSSKQNNAELCARYTELTNQWYADGCTNNPVLNALVDTVITHLHKNPPPNNGKPYAAIFDIDETVLSSYQALYNKISQSPSQQSTYLYAKIFNKQDLIKIEPIARLYTFCCDQKYTVFFVCGRRETKEHRSEITNNLRSHGFTTFGHLYLRPLHWNGTIASWKESIREAIAKDYNIVFTIDDDWRNIQGNHLGHCAIWVPSLLTQQANEDIFYEKICVSLPSHQHIQQSLCSTQTTA